jgi:hypothetical protein
MRATHALLVTVGVLGACKPEVGYDTYLCGVEADCPDGQACNGPDNRCVSAASALPFACDPMVEHEPDNLPAQAFVLPTLACVSGPLTQLGCLADGDAEDWLAFAVPAACTAVVAHLHLAYSIAYEEVPFEIADADGNVLEQAGECGADETSLAAFGVIDRCLKRTVTPGLSYLVHVKADPALSCDGNCAFNRYSLTLQLQTP